MNTTTLQVPVSKSLKLSAQAAASAQGFSSLQEAVRVFLKKLSDKSITLTFASPGKEWFAEEVLTPKEAAHLDRRYREIEKARKKGELFTAHSVKEMMQYLDS